MIRLLHEFPSVALLAAMGIGLLIAYLVVRGRRLGSVDLLLFVIMAAVFDGLVVVIHGMWRQNDPFNLIVLIALEFAVPVAAFWTLGVPLVALRMVHIGLTGGRAPETAKRKL